jgi:hypothetical protein
MSRKRGGTDKGEQQNEEGDESLPISMTVATDLKESNAVYPLLRWRFLGGSWSQF